MPYLQVGSLASRKFEILRESIRFANVKVSKTHPAGLPAFEELFDPNLLLWKKQTVSMARMTAPLDYMNVIRTSRISTGFNREGLTRVVPPMALCSL